MSCMELPFTSVRRNRFQRVTARKLRASVLEKPPVTLHRKVDATALTGLLATLREGSGAEAPPTLTSVIAVLVTRALKADNTLNAHLIDDELRRFSDVHLAVAVATDAGLVPPVLRPADLTDFTTCARRLFDLAAAARAGRLAPEDLTPATFTLSSLGAWGVEYFTPILNPPQVAILGVGALTRGDDGRAPSLALSLTFDHAAVDGVEGARFLETLNDVLAAPEVAQGQ